MEEVLSDAVGSLGVIVVALIVLMMRLPLADPIIGAGIGLVIIPRVWVLPRQAVNIMIEGTPPHVDLAKIARAMAGVPGVQQVHDLPVWTLTLGKEVMSGHVAVGNFGAGDQILRDLHPLLRDRFAVEHTTIQLESRPLVQVVIREATGSAADGAGEARPS